MANMIELDETEVVALRRNSELLNKALANPKAREQVLRGLKTANPELPVPELDAREPVLEAVSKLNERLDSFDKKIEDDKADRLKRERDAENASRWNTGRAKAAKEGYVGDSLTELEKFMEEKVIFDHDIAIPAFERLHPPAQPVQSTSNKFDFFNRKPEDATGIMKNIYDGNVDAAADQVLREIRGAA